MKRLEPQVRTTLKGEQPLWKEGALQVEELAVQEEGRSAQQTGLVLQKEKNLAVLEYLLSAQRRFLYFRVQVSVLPLHHHVEKGALQKAHLLLVVSLTGVLEQHQELIPLHLRQIQFRLRQNSEQRPRPWVLPLGHVLVQYHVV